MAALIIKIRTGAKVEVIDDVQNVWTEDDGSIRFSAVQARMVKRVTVSGRDTGQETMKWEARTRVLMGFDSVELMTRHGHIVEKWYAQHMRKESAMDTIRRAIERGSARHGVIKEPLKNEPGTLEAIQQEHQALGRLHRPGRIPKIDEVTLNHIERSIAFKIGDGESDDPFA